MTLRDLAVAAVTLASWHTATTVLRVVRAARWRTENWIRFGPRRGKALRWWHLAGFMAVHPIEGPCAMVKVALGRTPPEPPRRRIAPAPRRRLAEADQ